MEADSSLPRSVAPCRGNLLFLCPYLGTILGTAENQIQILGHPGKFSTRQFFQFELGKNCTVFADRAAEKFSQHSFFPSALTPKYTPQNCTGQGKNRKNYVTLAEQCGTARVLFPGRQQVSCPHSGNIFRFTQVLQSAVPAEDLRIGWSAGRAGGTGVVRHFLVLLGIFKVALYSEFEIAKKSKKFC